MHVLRLPLLPGLLLAALAVAQAPPDISDLELSLARYAEVERELRAADVTHLSPAQRAGREQVVRWLHEYQIRGDLGVNAQFPDERVPQFVDAGGRRCAIAFMLDRSEQATLVEEIAATSNCAWLVELAHDSRLRAWVEAHGLTLSEAARIQGPGFNPRRALLLVPPPPPPDWTGPEDATRGVRSGSGVSGAGSRGARTGNSARTSNATAARTSVANTRNAARAMGSEAAELDWQAWWRANRGGYVQRDREHFDVGTQSVRAVSARVAARAALLADLTRFTTDEDANLRSAATLTLGRLGGEAHVQPLQERLQDPQQSVRYLALLGLGALGNARASFTLASVAGGGSDGQHGIGPAARAFAILGLALARGSYDDGLVRAVVDVVPTHDDESLRMAALLYADLADPVVFADLAERLQGDRDEFLRGRALESLATVDTDAAVATLTRALSGRHRVLRRSAALALGRATHALALPALQTAYDLEREHLTRGVILLAIGSHGEPGAGKFLHRALERGAKSLRSWAALGLGLFARGSDDANTRAALRTMLQREKNDSAVPAYMLALGLARDGDAVPILAEAMRTDREVAMRLAAADALALIASDAARDALRSRMHTDPCATTRATLAELLIGIGQQADIDAVLSRLRLAEHDHERALLLFALGSRFAPNSYAKLRDTAKDVGVDARLRAAAVHALGRMLDSDGGYRFSELSRGSNWSLLPEWLDWLVQSTL